MTAEGWRKTTVGKCFKLTKCILLIRDRESIQWEQYFLGFGAYLEKGPTFRDEHIEFSISLGRAHMCKEPHNAPRRFKCIRPDHPAHGGVTLSTVQCRPASACARKSPPRVHSKETRQDKSLVVWAPVAACPGHGTRAKTVRKAVSLGPVGRGKSITRSKAYLEGRYISASEAVYRILEMDMHCMYPAVTAWQFIFPATRWSRSKKATQFRRLRRAPKPPNSLPPPSLCSRTPSSAR